MAKAWGRALRFGGQASVNGRDVDGTASPPNMLHTRVLMITMQLKLRS